MPSDPLSEPELIREVLAGRSGAVTRFTEEDAREIQKRARVVVMGMTPVRELFGEANPLGEFVKINKVNFQVIGILPEKGANTFDIRNMAEIRSALSQTSQTMGWLLSSIAAISLLVGGVFGFWPARKAAALNPIEALRYE